MMLSIFSSACWPHSCLLRNSLLPCPLFKLCLPVCSWVGRVHVLDTTPLLMNLFFLFMWISFFNRNQCPIKNTTYYFLNEGPITTDFSSKSFIVLALTFRSLIHFLSLLFSSAHNFLWHTELPQPRIEPMAPKVEVQCSTHSNHQEPL